MFGTLFRDFSPSFPKLDVPKSGAYGVSQQLQLAFANTPAQRLNGATRPQLLVNLSAGCGNGEEILHYPEIYVPIFPLLEGNTPPVGMKT